MITIYSTRTCGFCHAAKQYLGGLKVDYEEVKVDEIPDGAQKLYEKSGQLGVPVIDFDGEIIVGFNRPHIDLLLREKKLI
ncbi:MAG TPA: glutaredoxin domain-containing protein [Candidatus Saccharimonadales bacterium]|nr:glutaredoxin domain-containing protein [Candidatus Saccharimonadales bacterium]